MQNPTKGIKVGEENSFLCQIPLFKLLLYMNTWNVNKHSEEIGGMALYQLADIDNKSLIACYGNQNIVGLGHELPPPRQMKARLERLSQKTLWGNN